MSLRQVRKPQAKKRVETMDMAPRSVLTGAVDMASAGWLRVLTSED